MRTACACGAGDSSGARAEGDGPNTYASRRAVPALCPPGLTSNFRVIPEALRRPRNPAEYGRGV